MRKIQEWVLRMMYVAGRAPLYECLHAHTARYMYAHCLPPAAFSNQRIRRDTGENLNTRHASHVAK